MDPSWSKQNESSDFCKSCWERGAFFPRELPRWWSRAARGEPWLRAKPPPEKAELGGHQAEGASFEGLGTAMFEARWSGTLLSQESIEIPFFGLSWILFIELFIQWIFLCSMPGCREIPLGPSEGEQLFDMWMNLRYTFQGWRTLLSEGESRALSTVVGLWLHDFDTSDENWPVILHNAPWFGNVGCSAWGYASWAEMLLAWCHVLSASCQEAHDVRLSHCWCELGHFRRCLLIFSIVKLLSFPFVIDKCLVGKHFEIMPARGYSSFFWPLILASIDAFCLKQSLPRCLPNGDFLFASSFCSY